jgi:hypothetical protein
MVARGKMLHYRAGATAVLLLLAVRASVTQTTTQHWANFTFEWVKRVW